MKLDKEESKRTGIKVFRDETKKVEKVEKADKKKKSRDIFDEPKEESEESIGFRDEE